MARVAVAILTIVALAGCSLVDPFVTRKIAVPQIPAASADRPPKPGEMDEPPSLKQALDYAEQVKSAYRGAVRDQAQLQALLGLGLIPLTAAAIGLGATGASPNAVLALGLTGAAGLGTGMWLYNKPHQLAWIAGLKAVTCAEDAMAPLDVASDFDVVVGDLRSALTKLEEAAARLETAVDLAKAVRDGSDSSKAEIARALRSLESLENAARAEMEDTRAAIRAAEESLKSATELQQTLRTAGRRLVVAVSKITDEVDGLIVETQRDPQALSNVIAGLGSTFRGITTVPEGVARPTAKDEAAKKPSAVPQAGVPSELLTTEEQRLVSDQVRAIKAQEAKLVTALETTRTAAAAVASARPRVSDLVNSVVKDTPIDKLKGCGVKAGDLMTALAIDPAGPFDVTKPGSVVFTIKGGLPPYGAVLAAGQSGLIVAPAMGAVSVVATSDTSEGQYAVVVSDSTAQTKTVTVTVKKGAAKDTEKSVPTGAPAEALTQLATKLAKDKPSVTAQGVTVKITDAKISGDRVIVTMDSPQVAPDANTTEVAKALRDKILEEHGKGLNIAPEKVAFENFNVLTKNALDQKKTQPQSGCVDLRLRGPARDSTFEALDKPNREKLQRAVCLVSGEVDGRWGGMTKGKLILYQCRTGKRQDGVLTNALVTELLSLDEEKIRALCGQK